MFDSVGRRLAFLNAVVVIGVIAAVGLGIALFLRIELDRSESKALRERAESAVSTWSDQFNPAASTTALAPAATPDLSQSQELEDDGDGSNEYEATEALEGGDAVL